MKDKRAVSTPMKWVIGIIIAIVLIGGGYLLWIGGAFTASVIDSADEDFDGEFGDIELPDDAVGTDLVVGTANLVTLDVFNATFTSNINMNATNNVQIYAFKFEVESNGFEEIDIDGTLGSTIATTEAVIRKAYVMLDEEGLTVDSTNALPQFAVDLDNNLNKYSIEAENVLKGDYILVTELKGIAPTTILTGERLLDITFDADTDGDEDEGAVHINNG